MNGTVAVLSTMALVAVIAVAGCVRQPTTSHKPAEVAQTRHVTTPDSEDRTRG